MDQSFCGAVSLATDFYIYGYTSYENLTAFNMVTAQIEPFVDWSIFCSRFAVSYFCNYVFVPCDLTTGAPIPACSSSCDFLHAYCRSIYDQAVSFGATAGYSVVADCDNTLIHLQQSFGFPCSSSSLQNGCIDYLGM